MDASEKKSYLPKCNYHYTFKSNGKVEMVLEDVGICTTVQEGEWKLKDGGKVLEITTDSYTTKYDIQELTNKDLKTQSDHQTGYRSWMAMVKK